MIKGTDRNIALSELHPFKDHPYKVEDNAEMNMLCESIGKSGLLSPIIVRPRDEGGYEIISGHRRVRAYQRLGMTEIPSTVCEMTDEEAQAFTVKHSMEIQNAIKINYIIRTVSMLVTLVAAFILTDWFSPIATAIPLLMFRPLLYVLELIKKKGEKVE